MKRNDELVCVSDYFMAKFIVVFSGVTLILLASIS